MSSQTVPQYAKELFRHIRLEVRGRANSALSFDAESLAKNINGYKILTAEIVDDYTVHVRTNKGKRYGVVIAEIDTESHTAVVFLARGKNLDDILDEDSGEFPEANDDSIEPHPTTPGYMYMLRAQRAAESAGPPRTERAPRPIEPPRNRWNDEAKKLLVGRRIVSAFYMTDADANSFGWYERGLVLKLDDGTELIVFRDDEGNGPGALAWTDDNDRQGMLPVLRKGD
jgi:hypothetical protein